MIHENGPTLRAKTPVISMRETERFRTKITGRTFLYYLMLYRSCLLWRLWLRTPTLQYSHAHPHSSSPRLWYCVHRLELMCICLGQQHLRQRLRVASRRKTMCQACPHPLWCQMQSACVLPQVFHCCLSYLCRVFVVWNVRGMRLEIKNGKPQMSKYLASQHEKRNLKISGT